MIITVNVTQDCINSGLTGDCEKCPVALAMLQAGFIEPTVDASHLEWMEPSVGTRFYDYTPGAVASFVHDFDENGIAGGKPFSFVVDTAAASCIRPGGVAGYDLDEDNTETP